jgi:hypothetical protein
MRPSTQNNEVGKPKNTWAHRILWVTLLVMSGCAAWNLYIYIRVLEFDTSTYSEYIGRLSDVNQVRTKARTPGNWEYSVNIRIPIVSRQLIEQTKTNVFSGREFECVVNSPSGQSRKVSNARKSEEHEFQGDYLAIPIWQGSLYRGEDPSILVRTITAGEQTSIFSAEVWFERVPNDHMPGSRHEEDLLLWYPLLAFSTVMLLVSIFRVISLTHSRDVASVGTRENE